jgi:hypothetical protein
MSKNHRIFIAAAVLAASFVQAASALALGGMNHNEVLLVDD